MSVLVHLESSTLATLRNDRPALQEAARKKADRLLRELGPNALSGGQWSNGVGQIGLYVTPAGLDILRGSSHAISFMPGKPWQQTSRASNADGALDAVEADLFRHGHVDIEVLPQVEGMSVTVEGDSRLRIDAAAAAIEAATAHLEAAMQQSAGAVGVHQARIALLARARDPGASPVQTLRVNRAQLLALSNSPAIRSLRPVGFVDTRSAHFDHQAFEAAALASEADVIVTLRDVFGSASRLAATTLRAQTGANRGALTALLARAGVSALHKDFSEFGAVQVRMTKAQLEALRNLGDARLLSVSLNKPTATFALAVSGPTQNMAAAANAGYVGSGQTVVVADSGVQANHPFLAGKVVGEACFGTTQVVLGVSYQSVCPSANAVGDSPLGLPGSATPAFNIAHGTHVAGIASGQIFPSEVGLRGTAPGSSVYAVQVGSYGFNAQQILQVRIFDADILAVLQAAQTALPRLSAGTQPFTLNFSLGGDRHLQPCNGPDRAAFVTAVQQLRAAGVPVVAATGNNGFVGAMSFPACLPGVIKVSSVANDGIGNTRSVFNSTQAANLVDPAAFPGEVMWLAPGGGNGTSVRSSVLGGAVGGLSGTSMASPQITGLYASAKSADPNFGADEATAWFRGNAAVNVPFTFQVVGPGGQPYTWIWQRIRLPAL